jgi:dual specificity protein kinase YAK1
MFLEFNKNKILSKYTIDKEIGQGVYSKVYKCHLTKDITKSFAIKIYRNDEFYKKAGEKETQILLQLKNKKRFPQLYDYFIHNNHVILVQDFLPKNLESLVLNKCTYGLHKIKFIAKELLHGINELQNLTYPIIHADLKLDNLIVTGNNIKIIDFSNALYLDNQCIKLFKNIYYTFFTKEPDYVQARPYRAPEVILEINYLDKIDIWSLGCILVELFIGKYLFDSKYDIGHLDIIVTLLGSDNVLDTIPYLGSDILQKYFTLIHNGNYIYKKQFYSYPSNTLRRILLDANILNENLEEFIDFLKCIFIINPYNRPSASQLLEHKFLE